MSVYMQYKDGHIKVERFGENWHLDMINIHTVL